MYHHASQSAIYAGLCGAATAFIPSLSYAQPSSTDQIITSSTFVPFLLGCITGAALTGVVGLIASQVLAHKDNPADSAPMFEFGSAVQGNHFEERTQRVQELLGKKNTPQSAKTFSQENAEPAAAKLAARLPQIASSKTTFEQQQQADHFSSDYEQIAANYVSQQSFKEKMAARARGVAEVLGERLGKDKFEGLPIIERADGSVGDVGTGWWNARFGDSVRHVGAAIQEENVADDGSTVYMPQMELSAQIQELPALQAPQQKAQQRPVAQPEGYAVRTHTQEEQRRARVMRATEISRHVAQVELPTYPEQRTSQDLDHSDVWERALAAMGEKIAQYQNTSPGVALHQDTEQFSAPEPTPASISPATNNSNDRTNFIPYKVPANHPEVVDTDTYVDYLIKEEFSHNASGLAKKTSHDYLQLIEGGSQVLSSSTSLRGTEHASQSVSKSQTGKTQTSKNNLGKTSTGVLTNKSKSGGYKPRHMARVAQAKEA